MLEKLPGTDRSIMVTCPCGASVPIQPEQYFLKLHCPTCGRNFGILDKGTSIKTEQTGPSDNSAVQTAPSTSSAIQTMPAFTMPLISAETAVAAGHPTPSSSADAIDPAEDLRQIDEKWRSERPRHFLRFGRIGFVPSMLLGSGLGILLLVAAGFLMEMGVWSKGVVWLAAAATLGLRALLVWYCVYARANAFARAEDYWLRKRARTIAGLGSVTFQDNDLKKRRPRWHTILFGLALLAALALGYDVYAWQYGANWAADRDLQITFRVLDAETDQPIEGAVIVIPRSNSAFCSDCNGVFRFVTDAQGSAAHVCKSCMCFGYSGGEPFFRRRETFRSHTPDWQAQVSATGHVKSDKVWIREFSRTVERGDQFAVMVVTIKLQRLPEKK